MSSGNSQKGTRVTIMVVEGLVSIAALIAGLFFIVRPDGSLLGMSTQTLSGTPFSNYTVPGILLMFVVSGGTLLAACAVGMRTRNAAELVLASGAMLVSFELVEEALIGLNPQQPMIVFLGIILIALSLRLAGPMQTAQVELAGDKMVVRFPGASALLAFRQPLEIPLAHVSRADRGADGAGDQPQGFLGLGSWLPNVITAPRFHHADRPLFWNVSNPANAIVVQLHNENYSRLVIDVADPDATIATIRAAIAGQTRNAA
jgi:hypothetical protein